MHTEFAGNPTVVQFTTMQLRNLGAETIGLLGAIVATADGFEVAAFTNGGYTVSKLAAMASAMHGLGGAVVKEAGLRKCRDVIVDGLGGRIVLMSIPVEPANLLLMAICDERAVFGQLLLACRKCCVAIGEEIRRLERVA